MARTKYDHYTLHELNQGIANGEIVALDLPRELFARWAAWEDDPVDIKTFSLSDARSREEFLYQYCYYGEPLLLAAVSHIWESLAEPRAARCTAMGLASGAGGTGKVALVLMLQKMLAESLEIGAMLPGKDGFDSPDAWHHAVMHHFTSSQEQERALCRYYATLLDGGSATPFTPDGNWLNA